MIKFSLQYQSVKLEIDSNTECLLGSTTMWVLANEKILANAKFLLNFRGGEVHSIRINGQICTYRSLDPFREVGLPSTNSHCEYNIEELDVNYRSSYEVSSLGELEISLPMTITDPPNIDDKSDLSSSEIASSSVNAESAGQSYARERGWSMDSVGADACESSGVSAAVLGKCLQISIEYSVNINQCGGLTFMNDSKKSFWEGLQALYTTRSSPWLYSVDGVRCWLPCLDSMSQRACFDISFLNVPWYFDVVCSGVRTQKSRNTVSVDNKLMDVVNYRYIVNSRVPVTTIGWVVALVDKFRLPLYQSLGNFWVVLSGSASSNKSNDKYARSLRSTAGKSRNKSDLNTNPDDVDKYKSVYRDAVGHSTLGLDLGTRFLHKFIGKLYNYQYYTQIFVPDLPQDIIYFNGITLVHEKFLHTFEQIYIECPAHVAQMKAYLYSWFIVSFPIDSYAFEFLIHGAVQYLINIYIEYVYGEEHFQQHFLKMYDTVVHLERAGRSIPLVTVFPEMYERNVTVFWQYLNCKSALLYHFMEHRMGVREPMRNVFRLIIQSPVPSVTIRPPGLQRSVSSGRRGIAQNFPPPSPNTADTPASSFPPPSPSMPPPTPFMTQSFASSQTAFTPNTPFASNFPPSSPYAVYSNSIGNSFPPPTPKVSDNKPDSVTDYWISQIPSSTTVQGESVSNDMRPPVLPVITRSASTSSTTGATATNAPNIQQIYFINPYILLQMLMSQSGVTDADLNEAFLDRYMFDSESVLFLKCAYKMEARSSDVKARVLMISIEAIPSENRKRSFNYYNPVLNKMFTAKEDVRFRIVEEYDNVVTEGIGRVTTCGAKSGRIEMYSQLIPIKEPKVRGPYGSKKKDSPAVVSGRSRIDALQNHSTESVGKVIKTIIFDPLYTRLVDVQFKCPDSFFAEQVVTPFSNELDLLAHVRALRSISCSTTAHSNYSVGDNQSEKAQKTQLSWFMDVIQNNGKIHRDVYTRSEAAFCLAQWQNEFIDARNRQSKGEVWDKESAWVGVKGLIAVLYTLFVDETGLPLPCNSVQEFDNVYLYECVILALSRCRYPTTELYCGRSPDQVVRVLVHFAQNIRQVYSSSASTPTSPEESFLFGDKICFDGSHFTAVMLCSLSNLRILPVVRSKDENRYLVDIEQIHTIRHIALAQLISEYASTVSCYHLGKIQSLNFISRGVVTAAAITALAQMDILMLYALPLLNKPAKDINDTIVACSKCIDYHSFFSCSENFVDSITTNGVDITTLLNECKGPVLLTDLIFGLKHLTSDLVKAAALEGYLRICFVRFLTVLRQFRSVNVTTPSAQSQIPPATLAGTHLSVAITTVCDIICSKEYSDAFKQQACDILFNVIQDKPPTVVMSALSYGYYSNCLGFSDTSGCTMRDSFIHYPGWSTGLSAGTGRQSQQSEFHAALSRCKGRALKVSMRLFWDIMINSEYVRFHQNVRSTLITTWMYIHGTKIPRNLVSTQPSNDVHETLFHVNIAANLMGKHANERFKIPVSIEQQKKIQKAQRHGAGATHSAKTSWQTVGSMDTQEFEDGNNTVTHVPTPVVQESSKVNSILSPTQGPKLKISLSLGGLQRAASEATVNIGNVASTSDVQSTAPPVKKFKFTLRE